MNVNPHDLQLTDGFRPFAADAQSKLANITFAVALGVEYRLNRSR